jgi:hypothetical protein
MRILCIAAFLFLLISPSLYSTTSSDANLPGIYNEVSSNEKGELCTHSYIFTGTERIPERPIERNGFPTSLYSDTAVLWVDRNHQYAISENVTISGDGMSIFIGWWLNNERNSLYRSLGDGTPLWVYSLPLVDWMIDVSSSDDGHLLAAAGQGEPFRLWDKSNPIPLMEYRYPSGFVARQCAVSKDGSTAAAAAYNAVTGRLFAFNSAGDSLYAVDFDLGNGVYGVELSSDGSIAVVSTYYVISVFENGILRGTIGNYGQTAAKVSGDGNRIVRGDFSGHVTVYEWNGSTYNQLWQSTIGGPWVVAVDISSDGSTVMAGTGYSNGKAVMFDISSSTPLWSYQNFGNYGAYVEGVSLSDDGSIGAAASWGDTMQTGSFYVLTVHSKSDSTPIIGVTRNEEPGSLFDCAVSSNGQNITAGGKAVHAYQWGNGGEVYSILVGSTPSVNAATESIDNPTQFVQVGNTFSPQATYKNYGDNAASFDVYFLIEDSSGTQVYSSSSSIYNLVPNGTSQVIFSPDWSPSEYNYYTAFAWCELSGDLYPGDDTLFLGIKCFHDAEAREILVPFDETTINMSITPQAIVYNNGSYNETIEAVLTIRDSTGTPLYVDTTISSTVTPETEATVTFSPFSPPIVGTFSCELTATVADDIYPGNDQSTKDVIVTYEIIYDDGGAEAFYAVSSTYDNNKFAVRFTPTLTPPFDFVGGRIFVNGTDTLDYVQLCDDAGGLPDTLVPLRITYNVSSSAAPDWAYFTLDTFQVTTVRDFWLVIHWTVANPNSPGIGADDFAPNYRSWWYNDTNGWNNWTDHNWMIRLMQSPGASGMDESPTHSPICYRLYQSYPNPFRMCARIAFDIPEKTMCEIEIFDVSGRRVKTLKNHVLSPGHYSVEWKGRNQNGEPVASGVYFYRLKTGSYTKMRKILLIR